MPVRALANEDIDDLAPVLKHAFAMDPGLRWIIPGEAEWDRIAVPWFTMMLKDAVTFGRGITDEGYRGVSLWEPPGASRTLPAKLAGLVRTAMMLRGNLARAIQVQSHLERFHPGRPYWYLTYIATDPGHQGEGIGGALLAPVLHLADRQRAPVFLEC